MNEVKHIHIGRQQFTISVEAYGQLKDYLAAIKQQAGGAGAEVVEEVELRMAELLHERGVADQSVVVDKDVAYLKEQLGEPRDFKDDLSDDDLAGKADERPTARRLFRDTDHGMIAGVSAGLATYLNIDVVIVRIIFVALLFAGGSSILVYLLLWLLVPEAKTASDRLNMAGKPTTVDNLKQLVERADVPAAARRSGTHLGNIIRVIAKVILIMVGVGLIMAGIGTFIAAIVTLLYGLLHGAYVVGVKLFPVGSEQIIILLSGVVAVSLIATLLILLGITIARRKRTILGWIWAVLIGLFIVASSLSVGLSFDAGAKIRQQYLSLEHTRAIPISAFQTINFVGDKMYYDVVPGSTNAVFIKTLGSVNTDQIQVSEQNGTLSIDTSHFSRGTSCNFICPYGDTNTTIVIQTTGDVQALLPSDPAPLPGFKEPRAIDGYQR